jgi:uncharacterized glyoxalase superfamily protein PhnB
MTTTAATQGTPIIHEVFAYLVARDAARAIDFYKSVFGARETMRLDYQGKVGHAELAFGPTTIMIADEFPEGGIQSPLAFGGTGTRVHLHVDNVDRLAERAAAEGATILYGPSDEPHGERQCRLRDPFGHEWLLGHTITRMSPDEIKEAYRRVEESDAG